MTDHVYKSIEITGTSPEGITEAIQNGIAKATERLRHVDWFEVTQVRGHVQGDAVGHFQVTLKVGFRLE